MVARIGPVRERIAEHAVEPGPVVLTVDIAATDAETRAPDTLAFSVEGPEGAVELAELDGRYLSTQVAGGFTGRVIGMYVTEGKRPSTGSTTRRHSDSGRLHGVTDPGNASGPVRTSCVRPAPHVPEMPKREMLKRLSPLGGVGR